MKAQLAASVIVVLSCGLAAAAAGPIGLDALRDIGALPYFRDGAHATQVSSHDRTGGNEDGFNNLYSVLYEESGEYVIFDELGPGCLYNFWFTGDLPDKGNIRFYLDNETTPTVDAPLNDIFEDQFSPFLRPLSGYSSGGAYCYVPIPFRERLKVTTTASTAPFFHHFTFHRFDTDEGVATFTGAEDVTDILDTWLSAGVDPKDWVYDNQDTAVVDVPAYTEVDFFQTVGAGAVGRVEIEAPIASSGGVTVANPGFETGDLSDWSSFISQMTVQTGPWYGIEPHGGDYMVGIAREGSSAGQAAIYQQLSGAQIGQTYTAQAYVALYWTDGLPEATQACICLDPNGGTNPYYGGVEWSSWVTNPREGDPSWLRASVQAVAQSDTITVFLMYRQYAQGGDDVHVIAFDDVVVGLAPPDIDHLYLRMYWDGETQPSVDAPLGDFCGSGLGRTTVLSLPVSTTAWGRYSCFLPQPFWSSARLSLYNPSGAPVSGVECSTATVDEPYGDNAGYFHAKYNVEHPTTHGRDYTFLDTSGRGHFVGVVHTMAGADSGYLEGDERFHVNNSPSPCIYGTGTEDYYLGGWYFSSDTFTLPLHGHPIRVQDTQDRRGCYRFHISDCVPYETGCHLGIEHGGYNTDLADYTSVAYYYEDDRTDWALTDQIDVLNSASEPAHNYVISGQTWSGGRSFAYEGDDDGSYIYGDGREHTGYTEFDLSIRPDNRGVILVRRMDTYELNQRIGLYVDGEYVGDWYVAGRNGAKRWLDSEYYLPPSITAGKSTLHVETVYVSGGDASEFDWWAYTLLEGPATAESAPGALAVGWNLVSIPLEPVHAGAEAVFRDAVAAGVDITNSLFSYDGAYRIWPGDFADCRLGAGYWLYATAPSSLSLSGTALTDPWVGALRDGWNLIGCPHDGAVAWASCSVTDGVSTLSVPDAAAAGWIQHVIYYYGGGYHPVPGDDTHLRPWRGYWLLAEREGLSLRVPRP